MMSRRGLFRSLVGLKPTPAAVTTEVHQALADPATPPPVPAATARRMRAFPVHRPPGAVAEIDFLERCTRCGDCIAACPHDAIVLASARMRGAEGTPIIVASESPCLHCPDTPCASACAPKCCAATIPRRWGRLASRWWTVWPGNVRSAPFVKSGARFLAPLRWLTASPASTRSLVPVVASVSRSAPRLERPLC